MLSFASLSLMVVGAPSLENGYEPDSGGDVDMEKLCHNCERRKLTYRDI